MNKEALEFLKKHNIGCLTIMLPDGTLHGAALHFSHKNDPLTVFFSTDNTSRKAQGLLNGETQKASLVVGFSEEEWITIQMDGEVKAIHENEELLEAKKVHYEKHPGAKRFEDRPTALFLSFTPSWWRYTDFNTKPPTVLNSEK